MATAELTTLDRDREAYRQMVIRMVETEDEPADSERLGLCFAVGKSTEDMDRDVCVLRTRKNISQGGSSLDRLQIVKDERKQEYDKLNAENGAKIAKIERTAREQVQKLETEVWEAQQRYRESTGNIAHFRTLFRSRSQVVEKSHDPDLIERIQVIGVKLTSLSETTRTLKETRRRVFERRREGVDPVQYYDEAELERTIENGSVAEKNKARLILSSARQKDQEIERVQGEIGELKAELKELEAKRDDWKNADLFS